MNRSEQPSSTRYPWLAALVLAALVAAPAAFAAKKDGADVREPAQCVKEGQEVVCRGGEGSAQRTANAKAANTCRFVCKKERGIEVCRGNGPTCDKLLR